LCTFSCSSSSERAFCFPFPGVLKHQYHTPPARSNCPFQLSLSLAPSWAVRIWLHLKPGRLSIPFSAFPWVENKRYTQQCNHHHHHSRHRSGAVFSGYPTQLPSLGNRYPTTFFDDSFQSRIIQLCSVASTSCQSAPPLNNTLSPQILATTSNCLTISRIYPSRIILITLNDDFYGKIRNARDLTSHISSKHKSRSSSYGHSLSIE